MYINLVLRMTNKNTANVHIDINQYRLLYYRYSKIFSHDLCVYRGMYE